jgi:hypothetical protein
MKTYYLHIFIVLIICIFVYNLIMRTFNSFKRTIQIKNIKLKRKDIAFRDENNIKYKWKNSFIFGKYNFSEVLKIRKGNKITIKGYTIYYLPFLKENIVYDIL